MSVYKLTLPLFMKGVHPVLNVSIPFKHDADLILGQRHSEPKNFEIESQ